MIKVNNKKHSFEVINTEVFVKLAKLTKKFVSTDFFSDSYDKLAEELKKTWKSASAVAKKLGKKNYCSMILENTKNEDKFLGLAFAGSDSWIEFGSGMDDFAEAGIISESAASKYNNIVMKAGLYVW